MDLKTSLGSVATATTASQRARLAARKRSSLPTSAIQESSGAGGATTATPTSSTSAVPKRSRASVSALTAHSLASSSSRVQTRPLSANSGKENTSSARANMPIKPLTTSKPAAVRRSGIGKEAVVSRIPKRPSLTSAEAASLLDLSSSSSVSGSSSPLHTAIARAAPSRIPKRPSLTSAEAANLLQLATGPDISTELSDGNENDEWSSTLEDGVASDVRRLEQSVEEAVDVDRVEEVDEKTNQGDEFKQRWAELERREKEVVEAETRFEQELKWNQTNHDLIMRDLEDQAVLLEQRVSEVTEKSARYDTELRQLECARKGVEEERIKLERDRLQLEADRYLLQTQRECLFRRFEEVLDRVAMAAAETC
jgi:hypothetical protein